MAVAEWKKYTPGGKSLHICRKNVCQVMGDDHDDIAKLGKIFRDSSVLFTHIYQLVFGAEMTSSIHALLVDSYQSS